MPPVLEERSHNLQRLLLAGLRHHPVVHRAPVGGLLGRRRHRHRPPQVPLHQGLHRVAHGEAHHDALGSRGDQLQEGVGVVQRPETFHQGDAVQHQRLHRVQLDPGAPDLVQDVLRGGEEDVGPLGESPRGAQGRHGVPGDPSQAREGLGRAERAFAGGCEDQGPGEGAPLLGSVQSLEQGRSVRHQDSGPGAGRRHQVVAPPEHRDGGFLEGGRDLHALRRQGLHEEGVEVEIRERLHQPSATSSGSPEPRPPSSPGS